MCVQVILAAGRILRSSAVSDSALMLRNVAMRAGAWPPTAFGQLVVRLLTAVGVGNALLEGNAGYDTLMRVPG